MTLEGLLDFLFIFNAFLFQVILIVHFGLRKWRFNTAMRYGWVVYAFSFPSAALSFLMIQGGKPWSMWLAGLIYLVWAVFGYSVEYGKEIQWRNPIRWSIFIPYVFLYLMTVMFYWFPLALLWKPLWYIYAFLFIISTLLNITSHKPASK